VDVPLPDRVKLAAALFREGLRELGKGKKRQEANPKVTTMLRVVGVLLEGIPAEPGGTKAKGKKKDRGMPAELTKFVYGHIKEVDFLDLLSEEGLRDELLYILAALDPQKLPGSVELITSQLQLACQGAAGGLGVSGLSALLRTAVRWDLLATSLQPAWEHLLGAAKSLSQRQVPPVEAAGAAAVLEASFRDPEVRAALLKDPKQAESLRSIVQALTAALEKAWTSGLAELTAKTKALFGPGAAAWPRLLSLTLRVAMHLDYRPSAQEGHTKSDLAHATMDRLSQVFTSKVSYDFLNFASEAAPAPKRRKTGKASEEAAFGLPVNQIQISVRLHELLFEAMNAAHFLRPLRRSDCDVLARSQQLEECLWRWASLSDEATTSRQLEAWEHLARLLQQMMHGDAAAADVIAGLHRLLQRATDTVPTDNVLRQVLQSVMSRFEAQPEMSKLLASILDAATGIESRVVEAVRGQLQACTQLRRKLLPAGAIADEEKQKMAAIATPSRPADRGEVEDAESEDDERH